MTGSLSARAKTKRGRARGEGSIRRRKDGKYEGRVSLGCDSAGKRRQCSVYGKTRGEVLDKMHELRAQARSGIGPPKVAAASTFLEGWLESLRGRREPSTVATYERTVRLYLAPWLRKRPLTSLRPDDVETFLRELAKRDVGQRTIAKAYATLRAALTYALKTEKVSRNVAAMIEPPAYEPKKKTVFTVAQARAFLTAIEGHPAEALLGLALLTQIREGELLALRWSDVDLDAHTILVQRTMQDDETGRPRIGSAPKTRAGVRLVLLPSVAVAMLARHRERTNGTAGDLVFATRSGKPPSRQNVLQRWLYPLADDRCHCGHDPHEGTGCRLEGTPCGCTAYEARVPRLTFHELRHSGATLLGDEHLKALQQRLGHSSSSTTADIYLTLPVAAQKPLADRLDALFGRQVPAAIEGTNEGTRPKRRASAKK